MKKPAALQGSLGLKLFISYLVIVLIAAVVLVLTVQFIAPLALESHIESMRARLGDDPALAEDLRSNFNLAMTEVLVVGMGVALLSAIGVSIFTARRIVGPIRVMKQASQKIAAGDYGERISVPGSDELSALAQSFNQMAIELQQTERRRLSLIGDVSHELRTPLSSLRSTIEGIMDDALPASPSSFDSMQREVARLQLLVQDLEELSRAEAGQIRLERKWITISDLVQLAVDRLGLQFKDKGVTLQVKIASGLPRLWIDANRFTQVMLNLLGNALQYTPSGGSVILSVERRGGELIVQVKDTGIGIAAEHLPQIFERFYRVDKSRARPGGGSGIGLTIAKHIVEAHSGRIWAESSGAGQGTTVSIALPLPD
jgi:signal transduction histidine kinase